MTIVASVLIVLVAVEHLYILALEMFFITSETAQRTFRMPLEFVRNERVKTLFANQGLYNGFLAVGLLVAFGKGDVFWQFFFLGCVIVAALYGALTANKGILMKQGLPAILATIALLLS